MTKKTNKEKFDKNKTNIEKLKHQTMNNQSNSNGSIESTSY